MKKRFSALFLAICLLAVLFVGCDENAVDITPQNTQASSHEHILGEWKTVKAPTCIANGTARATCLECDYYQEKTIEKDSLKHNIKENKCTDCGKEYCDHIIYLKNDDLRSYKFVCNLDCYYTEFYILDEYEGYPVTVVPENVFKARETITSVRLPDSITVIESGAFNNCRSLKEINMPKNLKIIEDMAFNGCRKLKSVDLPEEMTEIGQFAFSECESLKSITLPKGLTCISDCMFSGCSSLEEIVIPEGVTTIKVEAFAECRSLKSLVLPSTLKEIEYHALMGCVSLESLTVPESVTVVGENALYNVKNITYMGTKSQWESIEFGLWQKNDVCTVKCTDGEIVYQPTA